jgi:hypothetical protein
MTPTATRDPRAALVAWRESIPYTQGEVGALFGVCKANVGHWEHGRTRVPTRVQRRLAAEGWLHLTPPRRQRAPLHHTPLCTTPCRSCGMRRYWLTHRATHPPTHLAWSAEADARLADLARTHTIREMAEDITSAFGIPRSYGAVRFRLAYVLHVQDCARPLTPQLVAYYCGVPKRAVTRWVQAGWLHSRQAGGIGGHHTITADAFAAFLEAGEVWVDWRQMPPSPWRDRAEMLWRRDPLYSLPEAQAWISATARTLRRYCMLGLLPAVRVMKKGGSGVSWRVRRSALMRFLIAPPARRRSA